MVEKKQLFRISSLVFVIISILVVNNGCDSNSTLGRSPQCGQHCVHRVCELLGVPISIEEVCDRCPPKNGGDSLEDLNKTFESIGLDPRGFFTSVRTHESLAEIPMPFIASLNGHFIVVDFYDKAKGFLRIFDTDGGRRLASVSAFLDRWDGYALAVSHPRGKYPLPIDHYNFDEVSQTAISVFGSLYLDAGDIDPERDTAVKYVVDIYNKGSKDLHILEVKSDCSCISIDIHAESIAPGDSGKIIISQDVSLLNGVYEKYVLIRTNDAAHSLVQVTLAGNASAELVSSHSKLDFGYVQNGRDTKTDVFIRYTGDTALILEPIELEQEVTVHVRPWELAKTFNSAGDNLTKQKFNTVSQATAHVGWSNVFRASIMLSCNNRANGELLHGEVKFKTNLNSVPLLSIPYTARVSEPCRVYPSEIFLERIADSDFVMLDRTVFVAIPKTERWDVEYVSLSDEPLINWKVQESGLPDVLKISFKGMLSAEQEYQAVNDLTIELVRKAPEARQCKVVVPVHIRIR